MRFSSRLSPQPMGDFGEPNLPTVLFLEEGDDDQNCGPFQYCGACVDLSLDYVSFVFNSL
jgi:hypothetical protein